MTYVNVDQSQAEGVYVLALGNSDSSFLLYGSLDQLEAIGKAIVERINRRRGQALEQPARGEGEG